MRFPAKKADIIIGPIAIVLAQAMMGEVTPKIAEAVACARGKKFLLPLTQENVVVAGVKHEPLPHLVDLIIKEGLKEYNDV